MSEPAARDRALAIIPARGGSRRFPRKNVALLHGKPLIAYAIEAALESGVFETVMVTSEDPEILAAARDAGPVWTHLRPGFLATDTAPVKHVCAHILEELAGAGDHYPEFAVLLPTSPLRTAGDIRAAHDLFRSRNANSVMSLVPFSHPPQRAVWAPAGTVVPYFGPEYMRPAQSLDAVYRHDGAIIVARTEVFLKEREFYGSNVAPLYMDPERSVDVDSPLDLAWAEFLISARDRASRSAT